VQFENLVVNDDVAGIDAALKRTTQSASAQDGGSCLPLVAPLSTDDDNVGQDTAARKPLLATRWILSDQSPSVKSRTDRLATVQSAGPISGAPRHVAFRLA